MGARSHFRGGCRWLPTATSLTAISMSTVSPETIRRLAIRHAREGSSLVAAPVFGRPAAAAARKLWICVSGAAPGRDVGMFGEEERFEAAVLEFSGQLIGPDGLVGRKHHHANLHAR